MKKTYLLLLVVLLPIISVSGQEFLAGQSVGGSRVSGIISTTPIVLNESVDGSPYTNKEYLPAKISAAEGSTFFVRYNAMRDEFEVKGQNNKAYSLNRYRRDIVVEIVPLKKKYQVFGYFDEKQNENFGYFVYLSDSNASTVLLKKERITFIGEKRAVTSYDTPRSARYKRWDDKFFMKLGEDKIVKELPRGKKAISKLFPEHKTAVFTFLKENKIKTSREEDLVQLMNYVNSL
ncbi:hypothetical protein [Psychroserpens ponticola]|uniref:Secreted protein n=1 Tax=Psychroserpens ponticola TaxID=2932268 RepID=A0ABY7RZC8_9FLAO|nr:hypothetical protein [Psychroserpens ponticola]WCO02060.1 hypothetical protein MUN68_000900 [Psychroserpens ponticola]